MVLEALEVVQEVPKVVLLHPVVLEVVLEVLEVVLEVLEGPRVPGGGPSESFKPLLRLREPPLITPISD